MKDKVSIIVPIYNVEEYLSRCIESLINQDYKYTEIILINDGSKDNSLKICQQYQKKNNNIIIIDKENTGVSDSRNVGIERATGKYIIFVDSDDYISKDYVRKLVELIDEKKVDCVISNGIDFTDDGIIESNLKLENHMIKDSECLISLLNEKYYYSVCWGKIYLTEYVKKIKFDKNMKIAEDFKFLVDYFEYCSAIFVTSYRGYYYYVRNGSAIRSGFDDRWYHEINFCEKLVNKYENSVYEKYAIKRYIRVIVTCLASFDIDNKNIKLLRKKLIKKRKKYLFSPIITIKEKIKFIGVCYFRKIYLFIKK